MSLLSQESDIVGTWNITCYSHDTQPCFSPFVLQETRVNVNEVPKIHHESPTEGHHSIYFKGPHLRVTLSLKGVFSCFPTRRPTPQELEDESILVVLVTPAKWEPSDDTYSKNESLMTDAQGGIVMPHYQPRNLLEDRQHAVISSLWVNPCESIHMDHIAVQRHSTATQFINYS